MAKRLQSITRSGLADRLGLFYPDLAPRTGSRVLDQRTQFYNSQGDLLGEHRLRFCPLDGRYEHAFFIVHDEEAIIDGQASIPALTA